MQQQEKAQQPIGDLVKELSDQTATLVRKEIQLATAELTEKGKHAGIGAGLFGGAGLIAVFGVAVLVASAVLGLATVLDAWLSALIIGAVLVIVAGVGGLAGKKQVDQAVPPAPEQAIHSGQRTIDDVKERAQR